MSYTKDGQNLQESNAKTQKDKADQWQNQDFHEKGAPKPQRWGPQPVAYTKFPRKLHEIKEIGPPGGHTHPPLGPPLQTLALLPVDWFAVASLIAEDQIKRRRALFFQTAEFCQSANFSSSKIKQFFSSVLFPVSLLQLCGS